MLSSASPARTEGCQSTCMNERAYATRAGVNMRRLAIGLLAALCTLLFVSFQVVAGSFSIAEAYEALNQALEEQEKLIVENNSAFCRSATPVECRRRVEDNERFRAASKAGAVRAFQDDERKLEALDCESMTYPLFSSECHRRRVEQAQRALDEADRRVQALDAQRAQLEAVQQILRRADERYERAMENLRNQLATPIYIRQYPSQPVEPRVYFLPQNPEIRCRSWFDGYYVRTDCN